MWRLPTWFGAAGRSARLATMPTAPMIGSGVVLHPTGPEPQASHALPKGGDVFADRLADRARVLLDTPLASASRLAIEYLARIIEPRAAPCIGVSSGHVISSPPATT
jgi:hypothetical protein